jgi:hypothetical protein
VWTQTNGDLSRLFQACWILSDTGQSCDLGN